MSRAPTIPLLDASWDIVVHELECQLLQSVMRGTYRMTSWPPAVNDYRGNLTGLSGVGGAQWNETGTESIEDLNRKRYDEIAARPNSFGSHAAA